jgi:hypothetical protein
MEEAQACSLPRARKPYGAAFRESKDAFIRQPRYPLERREGEKWLGEEKGREEKGGYISNLRLK